MPPSSPPAHGKEVNQVSRARPMRRVRVQVGCGYRTGSEFLCIPEIGGVLSYQQTGSSNHEIRDKEVRLVSDTGEQLGIMSAREALERAMDANLDLVKISPTANPPVCKLMDYGKYKFEQTKREKEARKNQHVVGSRKSACLPVST